LLFGKTEGDLDFTEQGSNGKPNEKGNKETPPRAVEGSHVGTSKTAKLDFSVV